MKLQAYLNLVGKNAKKWAEEVGLPKSTIYAYLKGQRKLLLSSAIAIHKATGGAVSLEELNGDSLSNPKND